MDDLLRQVGEAIQHAAGSWTGLARASILLVVFTACWTVYQVVAGDRGDQGRNRIRNRPAERSEVLDALTHDVEAERQAFARSQSSRLSE